MLYLLSHKLTRNRHCFIADLRPKAANTPRVKLDGNDDDNLIEPIDVLIPQDHLRELLLLQDGLHQHATIKKEALTDTDVKLSTANLKEYDEPETTRRIIESLKKGIIAFIIALLAELGLTITPFWLIFMISYYLEGWG